MTDDGHGALTFEDPAEARGFTQLPNIVLEFSPVSSPALVAYMLLRRFAWQDEQCYPGHARLAAHLGVSRYQVMRYLNELTAASLITITRRGNKQTNVYTIRRVTAEHADPGKQRAVAAARQQAPQVGGDVANMPHHVPGGDVANMPQPDVANLPHYKDSVVQNSVIPPNNSPVVVVQSSDTHRDDDGVQEPDEQPAIPTRVQRAVALLGEPPEDAWWYAELAAEYPQLKIDQEAQACKDHHCKHGNGTNPSFTWKPALSDWLWRSAHPKSRRTGQPAAGNGARPGSRSTAPAEPPRLPERSVPLWNKVQYAVYHEVGARSWEEHAWAQVDLIKPEGGGKLLMQAPARHREYYERKCDMVQRLLDEAMPSHLHLRVRWDYT